jgi:hypothetical protein
LFVVEEKEEDWKKIEEDIFIKKEEGPARVELPPLTTNADSIFKILLPQLESI